MSHADASHNFRTVSIGIMSSRILSIRLDGGYSFNGVHFNGEEKLEAEGKFVRFAGETCDAVIFVPDSDDSRFTLHGVTIGKKFHWERKEDEQFAGILKIINVDNQLQAINITNVEDYLLSVISSEMSCNAPLEYLKTQAVVSRSWLIRLQNQRLKDNSAKSTEARDEVEGIPRIIKYYENDAHTYFDVCADDHCQRYEGITKVNNSNAVRAIEETKGEVLSYDGEICDARFSKCCGGVTERFSACWEDHDENYLGPISDSDNSDSIPDLTTENGAELWIMSAPAAFCNVRKKEVLCSVLNDYDVETQNFYRWKVEYEKEELSSLFRSKSTIDVGEISDLLPLKRGASGRIIELLVVGDKGKVIIGKELEIRRLLSSSHVVSSAFCVKKVQNKFTLYGAGWGHGVGLCQIGAAAMAVRGIGYKQILAHYFKDSQITNIYE